MMRVPCGEVSCLKVVGEAIDVNLPSGESLYTEGPDFPSRNLQAVHTGTKDLDGQLKTWPSG